MKTVLICDDEQVVRKGLKLMLKDLGFDEIYESADGEAAVYAAFLNIPDIIIMDVSMPKKDGITAANEIRKRLKVPIIFLTACQDLKIVRKALKAGIAAFLTKPVRSDELWPAIELAWAHNDEVENLKEEVENLKEQVGELKQSIENRKIIERAKGLLMKNHSFAEPEAFRRMQKLAMDKRKSLRQIAEAILLTE